MSIYKNQINWKIYLAIGGVLIVGTSLFVSNYLANQIAEGEREKVELWALSFEEVMGGFGDETPSRDTLTEEFQEDGSGLISPDSASADSDALLPSTVANRIFYLNDKIPIIVVDALGEINNARNFGDRDDDYDYLKKEVDKLRAAGQKPIIVEAKLLNTTYYVYYKNSWLYSALQYFPILNLLLIASFVAVAYLMFSASRKSEQNRVWVGMAKETAHQLGTPISGILAWIEHLKMMKEDDPETQEIVEELTKDVNRLELVADRFSKIGSRPELEAANVYDVIERNFMYMEKRAPRRVNFVYPENKGINYKVNINNHLFDWVVENLLRNALDALDGNGTIYAHISLESNLINIEISDTGKGIPSSKFKTIFRPGFTTKKRGWGLGLSLTKRIIESYHSGKIFVKKSVVGEGTTFCIQLPKL